MFRDFLDLIKTLGKKMMSSRLVVLGILFSCMFLVLVLKLFQLQIVNGEQYLRDYIQKTEKEVTTPGTRGNIYDRNGNVLAYNELAYVVTIQDTGDYTSVEEKNAMILRLVRILNKHGEKVEGRFEVGIDEKRRDVLYFCFRNCQKAFFKRSVWFKNNRRADWAGWKISI